MLVQHAPTPNFRVGRDGHAPRGVVLHTTDGTFDAALAWFSRAQSGVSAHYVVGLDGYVTQLVDEADTALHAGRLLEPTCTLATGPDPNLVTIGIELVDNGNPHHVVRPDAQYRAAAVLLAGIARRWSIELDREHVVGHRELFAAKTCPGNVDTDRLLREARDAGAEIEDRPRLTVLLPVRNGAADLPGWLDSVRPLADAVVALDDGSTDDTAALLEADPLVHVLVRNPRRDSYAGWDDSANRNRLLDAATELAAEWVLFLDVDERIEPDDAAALRVFLDRDALPGLAFGFKCFRQWGGEFDPDFRWVYRLFVLRAGDRVADQRLHFNPVPVDLPLEAYVRTTLRIRHLGAVDDERMLARLAKYRDADPDGVWSTSFGGHDAVPQRTVPWWRRSPDEPVIVAPEPGPSGATRPSDPSTELGRCRVVCLLAARNAVDYLPGWFDSVRPFADAVVALDDGSTDDTAALLDAEPLVRVLLRNLRRDSYVGWDDSENRNRLLEAAGKLAPDWVISLDADERVDPSDAEALHEFIARDAIPGLVYGFRVHRMIGDDGYYDRSDLSVYRLFAWEPHQMFPAKRLHFVPVPVSIPRDRWIRTTIRIQHLASTTEERRQLRFEKYRQADPDCEFQASYDEVLDPPAKLLPFTPRPPGLPVVLPRTTTPLGETIDAVLDLDAPMLSAVVIAREDEERIERAVSAVVGQECPVPFEVIVVVSGRDHTASIVRDRFPDVRLVELARPALPGEARNAGLAVARGDIVSFPGSHVELRPGSLAARVRAHEAGWEMVTGTILNGTLTAAGWAAYFLDHSTVLPNRPSGELETPPAHCSYLRHLLDAVGGFPEDRRAGEDTVVNNELFARGYRAYRAADVTLVHRTPCDTVPTLMRHFFLRGRAWARILIDAHGSPRDLVTRGRRKVTRYPWRRLDQVDQDVELWGGRLTAKYRRVRPLVVLAILASWSGMAIELLMNGVARGSNDSDREARGPVPAPDPVVFIHVPKTSGTTVRGIVESQYPPDTVVRIVGSGPRAGMIQLEEMDPERLLTLRAVTGHMAYGVHRYLSRRARYVTMLRDPVDRIISHYYYVQTVQEPARPPGALDGVANLADYVTISPTAPLTNNEMTRLLGGAVDDPGRLPTSETLKRAKRNLDGFAVVGLLERFDESLLLMRRAFGWYWPVYAPENVASERPLVDEVPPEIRDLIARCNELDAELYLHACERFEKQLAEYGGGLDVDRDTLRRLCEARRFEVARQSATSE